MKKFLMMGGALGAFTAAERSKGRYMRAPDGHDDGGYADFDAAGDVEVGKGIESNDPPVEEKPKPKARAPKAAPAAKPPVEKPVAEADADGEGDEDDDGENEDEEKPKPKRQPSERIKELSTRLRQSERLRLASDSRLDALEKRLLSGNQDNGNRADGNAPPDPSDDSKYPLGHLDDRYIEDKLEWLAENKAAKQADAVLQRQQEGEQKAQAERQHADLLDKVDTLSTRGAELFDDFQERVIEDGMKGEWKLAQPTFEAAHEADNGAQILYELSLDKKEALRVSELSPYGQAKYVMERDAEIGGKAKPRKIPRAGEPPSTRSQGANSSTRISPATDNLDDFEKAWERDAKGK